MTLAGRRMTMLLVAAATALAAPAVAEEAAMPTYAADVPEAITTPDVVDTRFLGRLEFFNEMPSPATVEKAYDYLDFARGVEAFHTGMPAASVYAIIEGLKAEGVAPGTLGIFEDLMDARSLFLTPNTTSLYAWGSIDLSAGPVVMEVPPGVLGLVDDAYFRYVADLGKTGPDAGAGGEYLFLPPGYEDEAPDGYFTYPVPTHHNEFFFRGTVVDGDTAAAAQAIKESFRQYALAEG